MSTQTAETQERVEDILERIGVPMENAGNRERMTEHVRVHKYFLDLENKQDTSWEDATASWGVRVWTPVRDAIDHVNVRSAFLGRSLDDLFFEVSDHWHYLKSEGKQLAPDEAAKQYARTRGNPVTRVFGSFVLGPIRHWLQNDMEAGRRIDQNIRRMRTSQESNMMIPPFHG